MKRARKTNRAEQEIVAAIRAQHLKANITGYPPEAIQWEEAWADSGGTLWGPGPYLKVPVRINEDGMKDEVVRRVYAPAALRRKLAATYRFIGGRTTWYWERIQGERNPA